MDLIIDIINYKSLIAKYKGKTTLINNPSYSVYRRHDFKDIFLSTEMSKLLGLQLGSKWFFTAYEQGGFILLHSDGHSTVNNCKSVNTVLFYLNNDYEGGELVIPNMGAKLKPTEGTVVILDQDSLHYVNPIKSGDKFILRVDSL